MWIAYTRPSDGGVTILNVASRENLSSVLGDITASEYVDHVFSRSIPRDAIDVTVLPMDWVEPDRYKRNNWRLRNGEIVVEGAI